MGLHRQLILGTAPLLFFLCDKALHIKKTPPQKSTCRGILSIIFSGTVRFLLIIQKQLFYVSLFQFVSELLVGYFQRKGDYQ